MVRSELVVLSTENTHTQHTMLTRSTHPEPDLERKRIQRWPDWQNRPTEAHNPWHPASETRRGQLEKRKKSRETVSRNECSEQHMLVPQKPRTSSKPMKHKASSTERKTERETFSWVCLTALKDVIRKTVNHFKYLEECRRLRYSIDGL